MGFPKIQFFMCLEHDLELSQNVITCSTGKIIHESVALYFWRNSNHREKAIENTQKMRPWKFHISSNPGSIHERS